MKINVHINPNPDFKDFAPIDGTWSIDGDNLNVQKVATKIADALATKYRTNGPIKVEIFRSNGRAMQGEERGGNFVAVLQLNRR